jgi:two-component system sensor histidine kinase GlrK
VSAPDPAAETTLALAHALRTPLTSLALGLGLLDDGALGPLNDPQREVVRALVVDVARLSRLVGDELRTEHLGAYAGPVDRARVDLGALVERSVDPIRPQAAERAVSLELDLAAGIGALCDPVKMGWVVASLLGNALRYSPRESTIFVRLARADAGARLQVVDQGPGMTGEVAGRLFERGGGLGLFLVREIVEAHGGSIAVASAAGSGATFTIELPAS